jgi:hypothetical protein
MKFCAPKNVIMVFLGFFIFSSEKGVFVCGNFVSFRTFQDFFSSKLCESAVGTATLFIYLGTGLYKNFWDGPFLVVEQKMLLLVKMLGFFGRLNFSKKFRNFFFIIKKIIKIIFGHVGVQNCKLLRNKISDYIIQNISRLTLYESSNPC